MATVFIGTSQFAAAVLERLAAGEHRPALVITRPDRPAGRGRQLRPPPVGEPRERSGCALEQPEDVNAPESLALIAEALDGGPRRRRAGRPSVVVVCAFGALIKEPLLSAHEILNVHPSLLPRWRGAAPIERAIMAGDERTGVSIMRLTAGLDSGPVCLAAEEPIAPEDDYGALAARLQVLGAELLDRAPSSSDPPCAEQPEQGVTYAEKIAPADRLLDPLARRSSWSARCGRCTPTSAPRLQLAGRRAAGRAPRRACSRRRRPRTAEASAGACSSARRAAAAGLLARGCSSCSRCSPPGARAMDAGAYLRGHAAPGRR